MSESLIPRQVLFADPDKTQIKLSPNGEIIAYLGPYQGVLNIWLAPLNALDKAEVMTKSEHPIRDYWWTPDGKWIIFSHDYFGDENWQLYGYNLVTQEMRTYTQRGCQARLLQMNKAYPDKISIALNERDKRYHDVFIFDLNTGDKKCIFENDEYWDFIVDNDFQCRVGIKLNAHSGEYVDLKTSEMIYLISQHDLFGLYFCSRLKSVFASDNNTLYVIESNTSNTSSLLAIDIKHKKIQILANHPQADLCDVLYESQTKTPIAYAINDTKKQWFGLEDRMKSFLDHLNQDPLAEVDLVSQNEKTGIISFAYSDKPTQYYHYDYQTRQLNFLFLSHNNLEHYFFNPMQAIEIPVRDGRRCMSYLTLPASHQGAVPMVMVVHGSPSRDFWGFNVFHQWLSNRGYAVLSVNYRASMGFGRSHSEAGNGEWAGKIREDLIDAMDWAIEKGITSSDQVAILGRSFGGYQVLVGLTFTPDRYCCGVDIVGPANLETMMRCFPPYWGSMRGILNNVVGGDPNTELGKQFLKENSPSNYADRIQRPLLIGHGMNDPRIHQTESDQMVAAMRANRVSVTYAVFLNEGHQLSHSENRIAFYGLVEAFLARNLQATKHEPCHEKIPSTIELREDDFGLAKIVA